MAAIGPVALDSNDDNHNVEREELPLPQDIFNGIASYLPLKDLFSLRQVCFHLYRIGQTNDPYDLVDIALEKASASDLTQFAQANYSLAKKVLLNPLLIDKIAVSDLIRIFGAHDKLYKPILLHRIFNEHLDSFLLIRFSQLSNNIAQYIVQQSQLAQMLSEFDLINLAFSSKDICHILANNTSFINRINETFFYESKVIVRRISQTQLLDLCAAHPDLDFPHTSESSHDFFKDNPLFDMSNISTFMGEYRRMRFSQSYSNSKCLIGGHVYLSLHRPRYNVFSMNIGSIHDKLVQDDEPCSFKCALKHNAQKEFIQESHKMIYLIRLIREQIQVDDELECLQSLESLKL